MFFFLKAVYIFFILACTSRTCLFAGTLGFVMSEVEDGKPFSQVVRSAKNLGYTEPGLVNCSPASVYLINRFLVFLVEQLQLGKKLSESLISRSIRVSHLPPPHLSLSYWLLSSKKNQHVLQPCVPPISHTSGIRKRLGYVSDTPFNRCWPCPPFFTFMCFPDTQVH